MFTLWQLGVTIPTTGKVNMLHASSWRMWTRTTHSPTLCDLYQHCVCVCQRANTYVYSVENPRWVCVSLCANSMLFWLNYKFLLSKMSHPIRHMALNTSLFNEWDWLMVTTTTLVENMVTLVENKLSPCIREVMNEVFIFFSTIWPEDRT